MNFIYNPEFIESKLYHPEGSSQIRIFPIRYEVTTLKEYSEEIFYLKSNSEEETIFDRSLKRLARIHHPHSSRKSTNEKGFR